MSEPTSHWRVLAPSFWRYRVPLALTVLCALGAAVFEGVGVGLLIPFLENLSDADGDAFRTGWEWADRVLLGVEAGPLDRLYRICGLILAATWLRASFDYLSTSFAVESRARIVEHLRLRTVDQLQAVALRFFSDARAGEILNTLTNELQRVSNLIAVASMVASRGSLLIAYIAFMLWVSWELTALVLVFFGLLSVSLVRVIMSVRARGRKVTKANGAFTSAASELLSGARTIRAYAAEAFERERLRAASDALATAQVRTGRRGAIVHPLSQVVIGTVLVVVILLATQFFVLTGRLDLVLLLTFLFALFRLMPLVHQLNEQRGRWAQFVPALDNVAEILRRDDKPYLADGDRPLEAFRDELVFDDVSFEYVEGEPVLNGVSFRVPRGKTVAIVGASGSGKSTLVDFIPRFHDPTRGRVLLDGHDLREYRLDALRSRVAVVSQSTFIFNDTVQANIAYGQSGIAFDEIVEAARQANALSFIEALPQGFDTPLGDQGVRLSGGQRQRLAIARALLRSPDILVLDEATSALDSISEREVQDALEALMRDRTVVVVAHRLSTIEDADHVVVLEDGEIVEEGTYEELLARRGQLWTYHALQYQVDGGPRGDGSARPVPTESVHYPFHS